MDTVENKFDVQFTKPSAQVWGVSNDTDGRQAVPDPSLPDTGYDYQGGLTVGTDRARLGEGWQGEGDLKDDDYPPSPPPGTQAGVAPSNAWQDMDFGAVAPYKYPDFGSWPGSSSGGYAGALRTGRD